MCIRDRAGSSAAAISLSTQESPYSKESNHDSWHNPRLDDLRPAIVPLPAWGKDLVTAEGKSANLPQSSSVQNAIRRGGMNRRGRNKTVDPQSDSIPLNAPSRVPLAASLHLEASRVATAKSKADDSQPVKSGCMWLPMSKREKNEADDSQPNNASLAAPSRVSTTKMALFQEEENWKATPEWKKQQRSSGYLRAQSAPPMDDEEEDDVILKNRARNRCLPSGFPPMVFKSGSEMLELLMHEIRNAKKSIYWFQYVVDHTDAIIKLLERKQVGKVDCRILMDKANFECSSCARQAARCQDLFDAEVEMRTLKPASTQFACMHAKTLIFDNRVIITGSCNVTHNGLENNLEHMIRLGGLEAIPDVVKNFLDNWQLATVVDETRMLQMRKRAVERDEKKKTATATSKAAARNKTFPGSNAIARAASADVLWNT